MYMPTPCFIILDSTVMCAQSCCCGNFLFILFPILIWFSAWHLPCQPQLCHNEGPCSVCHTNRAAASSLMTCCTCWAVDPIGRKLKNLTATGFILLCLWRYTAVFLIVDQRLFSSAVLIQDCFNFRLTDQFLGIKCQRIKFT